MLKEYCRINADSDVACYAIPYGIVVAVANIDGAPPPPFRGGVTIELCRLDAFEELANLRKLGYAVPSSALHMLSHDAIRSFIGRAQDARQKLNLSKQAVLDMVRAVGSKYAYHRLVFEADEEVARAAYDRALSTLANSEHAGESLPDGQTSVYNMRVEEARQAWRDAVAALRDYDESYDEEGSDAGRN